MSDSYDPTRASGVPTPPAGSPPVGGTGPGATPGAAPPPTVASSSIYTDPPATAYGAGGPTPPGPTGPGGPGDGSGDDWGPEGDPDDRWKIYALVGLAIVVIALLIGGIILSQRGEDDDPPATTSSTSSSTTSSSTTTSSTSTSTTTTTAPTTTTAAPTTTTDPGPPGAASPEAASASLYNAWTAGDQANASQFADPGAVTTLFERDGRGNDLSFEGCSSTGSDTFDCTYSNDIETLVLEVDEVPRGFRVTGVSFPGD